jgi:hypothetical protein
MQASTSCVPILHGPPATPDSISLFVFGCRPPLPMRTLNLMQPAVLQKWFVQFNCAPGSFNDMASLLLSPSEVRDLPFNVRFAGLPSCCIIHLTSWHNAQLEAYQGLRVLWMS